MASKARKRSPPVAVESEDPEAKRQLKSLMKNTFECPICCDTFTWPVYKCTNGHRFCQKDFLAQLEANGGQARCPECRCTDEPRLVKSINRVLGQKRVSCTVDGCSEKPALEDLDKHVQIYCKFVHTTCVECQWQGPKGEAPSHVCGTTESTRKLKAETNRHQKELKAVIEEIKLAKKERDSMLDEGRRQLANERRDLEDERKRVRGELEQERATLESQKLEIETKLRAISDEEQRQKEELIKAFKYEEQQLQTHLFSFYKKQAVRMDVSTKTPKSSFRTKLFAADQRLNNLSCDVLIDLYFSTVLNSDGSVHSLQISVGVTRLEGTTLSFPLFLGGIIQLLNLEQLALSSIAVRLDDFSDKTEILTVTKPTLDPDDSNVYRIWLLLAARVW